MKLFALPLAIVAIALTSCDTSSEYQGNFINQTGDTITVKVYGERLLRNEIEILPNQSQRYYFESAIGDNENYDCSVTFDSLKYTINQQEVTVISDTLEAVHETFFSGDQTRVHECDYYIK